MGAKDYLVKPIRINECRGLVNKMRQITYKKTEGDEGQPGIAKYEIIRELGHGAAGKVHLIRSKEKGEFFALKTINLSDL